MYIVMLEYKQTVVIAKDSVISFSQFFILPQSTEKCNEQSQGSNPPENHIPMIHSIFIESHDLLLFAITL